MRETLSLSPRTHLFIKDGALWVKLQKPNQQQPMKPDFYIIKKLKIAKLQALHEWSGQILKEMGESK